MFGPEYQGLIAQRWAPEMLEPLRRGPAQFLVSQGELEDFLVAVHAVQGACSGVIRHRSAQRCGNRIATAGVALAWDCCCAVSSRHPSRRRVLATRVQC